MVDDVNDWMLVSITEQFWWWRPSSSLTTTSLYPPSVLTSRPEEVDSNKHERKIFKFISVNFVLTQLVMIRAGEWCGHVLSVPTLLVN